METCKLKIYFVNHLNAQFSDTKTYSKNGFEWLFLTAISSLVTSCGLWGVDLT